MDSSIKTVRTSVHIKIPDDVLSKIKANAAQLNMPYQTLINTLLTKYANGKIKLDI